MIKKTITYEDFNGVSHTDDFYFHLSKAEVAELEFSEEGGLSKVLNDIIEAENIGALIRVMKRLILMAYGKKSDDGLRFIKNEEDKKAFVESPAYSELFMEIASDDTKAANFVKGIMPTGLDIDLEKM